MGVPADCKYLFSCLLACRIYTTVFSRFVIMLRILVLVVALALAQGNQVDELEVQWKAWKSYHGKTYETKTEEAQRYAIWRNNLEIVRKHNAEKHSYTLAMNQFGDLTATEFKYLFLGFRQGNSTKGSTFLSPSNVALPDTVDWRTKGYVTPVKNQKQCGSCWAFSTTGSLEGQHFKKTGNLVSLSEQNLVDCSNAYGNHGCQGGLMDNAFQYIEANGGITTEEEYPYTAHQGHCHYDESMMATSLSSWENVRR